MLTVHDGGYTRSGDILVIDDDPDTCNLLAFFFSKRGYVTTVANSGPEALEWVELRKPDVIILDVMMPGMDGWEVFDQLGKVSDTPVLFLTATTSGESAVRALKAGAIDYVRKPFDLEELLARVETMLLNRRNKLPAIRFEKFGTDGQQRPYVSVVIPTLNEADNLPLVLPYIPMNWVDEVILVDGSSTDGTVEVAKRLLPSIKVVLETKKGKGAAMRAGYNAAKGDVIIVLDADGSNDPREIPRFVKTLMEGSDFVKGSRFSPGGGTTDMPRYRKWGNLVFTHMVNILFNATFTDLCYGYHAFWRYCLEMFDLDDVDGFEIDTAIYTRALRARLRITEIPSFEGYRFHGIGKLKTIPDGFRVLRTIIDETLHGMKEEPQELYLGFRGEPPSTVEMPVANKVIELWEK